MAENINFRNITTNENHSKSTISQVKLSKTKYTYNHTNYIIWREDENNTKNFCFHFYALRSISTFPVGSSGISDSNDCVILFICSLKFLWMSLVSRACYIITRFSLFILVCEFSIFAVPLLLLLLLSQPLGHWAGARCWRSFLFNGDTTYLRELCVCDLRVARTNNFHPEEA